MIETRERRAYTGRGYRKRAPMSQRASLDTRATPNTNGGRYEIESLSFSWPSPSNVANYPCLSWLLCWRAGGLPAGPRTADVPHHGELFMARCADHDRRGARATPPRGRLRRFPRRRREHEPVPAARALSAGTLTPRRTPSPVDDGPVRRLPERAQLSARNRRRFRRDRPPLLRAWGAYPSSRTSRACGSTRSDGAGCSSIPYGARCASGVTAGYRSRRHRQGLRARPARTALAAAARAGRARSRWQPRAPRDGPGRGWRGGRHRSGGTGRNASACDVGGRRHGFDLRQLRSRTSPMKDGGRRATSSTRAPAAPFAPSSRSPSGSRRDRRRRVVDGAVGARSRLCGCRARGTSRPSARSSSTMPEPHGAS